MGNTFEGLRTCIYKVSDLDKAKKWYAEAFETEPYFDEPFYVGFNIGGYELGLLPKSGDNAIKTDNVATYWGVANVEDVYKKLLDHGAKQEELPTDVGDGIIVATVRCPWNNLIGIIYNPYFKLPE